MNPRRVAVGRLDFAVLVMAKASRDHVPDRAAAPAHRPHPGLPLLRGRPSETAQSVSGVQCTLFAPPLWPEIRPQ